LKSYIKFLLLLILFSSKAYPQCDRQEIIKICDITAVDVDNDGIPDGILNLYDAYLDATGDTLDSGTWFDPNFDFVLNPITGDVLLWSLNKASENTSDYKYELYTSNCGETPTVTINIVLGAFSGYTLPPFGANNINYRICNTNDICGEIASFNLLGSFQSSPAPHSNGYWEYIGNSSNFIKIEGSQIFIDVPYEVGPPLVDEEIFEFVYKVPDIVSCLGEQETTVKVSVVRQASSGESTITQICEQDIIDGFYDSDIVLSENRYLADEDSEGEWSGGIDTGNQISSRSDAIVNIKAMYEDFRITNPRFGVKTFNFRYEINHRSLVCSDLGSDIPIVVYESLRPFQQQEELIVCVDENTPSTINLIDEIEFTTENGVLYDYRPGPNATWEFVSGPSVPTFTSEGEVKITNAALGDYVYKYTVSPEINCNSSCTAVEYESNGCLSTVNNTNHLCVSTESALINFSLIGFLYPGENTTGVELCNNEKTVDLISLLNTNGIDTVYRGGNGVWTDSEDNVVSNDFIVPEIIDNQLFNFTYVTTNSVKCIKIATLDFTIFNINNVGEGSSIHICETAATFNLFDVLTGDKDTNGTWSGPSGFTDSYLGEFNPKEQVSGDYTYAVPSNGACMAKETIVSVTISKGNYAGEDTTGIEMCNDKSHIDLISLLKTNGIDAVYRGENSVWTDIENNKISNDFLVPVINENKTFNFIYTTTDKTGCENRTSLSFTIFASLSAGIGSSIEICESEPIFNLFDVLTGDKDTNGTWSGPNGFSASYLGEFNPAEQAPGAYIYSVTGVEGCPNVEEIVNVDIPQVYYAGENTTGIKLCANTTPINLISMLETNGVNTVHIGEEGVWVNDINTVIPNNFKIPNTAGEQIFDFTYITTNKNGCKDSAILNFKVLESLSAGLGSSIEICESEAIFNLFDVLTGDKDTNGTWSGPNGYIASHLGVFNPSIHTSGNYVYTISGNNSCTNNEAVIAVTVHKTANAGEDFSITICKSEGEINLLEYLSSDVDYNGIFITQRTNINLSLGILDITNTEENTVVLEYIIDANSSCAVDTAIITVEIITVDTPIIQESPNFCIKEVATLLDVEIAASNNYNWYESDASKIPLSLNTVLKSGIYYLSTINNEDCESVRVPINVTINDIGEGSNCASNIKDGVSPNGDGINDTLDLSELEESFPNYRISIYNRYGIMVYKGKKGSSHFSGNSNVSSSKGNKLPQGVYYYVFEPNNSISKSFQDSFYLSR